MQAASFGFLAIGLALAAWVYLDAVERGIKFPALWGLAVLAFGTFLVPELVYLGVRSGSRRYDPADGLPVRQYLVTTVLASMCLAVIGACFALGALLSSDRLGTNDLRDLFASGVAAAVIGGIIWVTHWRVLGRRIAATRDDAEFRALYGLRRTELLTVAFLFGVAAAAGGLVLLGGGLSALLQASYAATANWLWAAAPLVIAGAAAVWHAVTFRELKRGALEARYLSIPAPSPVERRPLAPYPPPPYGPYGHGSYASAPAGYAVGQGSYPPAATTAPSRYPTAPAAVPDYPPPAPLPASGVRSVPAPAVPPVPPPGRPYTAPTGQTSTPPSGRSASPTDDTFCAQCGTRAGVRDRYCSACGAAIAHRADQPVR